MSGGMAPRAPAPYNPGALPNPSAPPAYSPQPSPAYGLPPPTPQPQLQPENPPPYEETPAPWWYEAKSGGGVFDPRTVGSTTKLLIQSGLGTYMHVNGGAAIANAEITTSSLMQLPNLHWVIEPVPNQPAGVFYICSALNRDFVLHQNGATQENGGGCTLFGSKTNHLNTWVTFEPCTHGWHIRFVHSKKCVRVQKGHLGPGIPLVQWDPIERADVKWRFFPVVIDPRTISPYTKLTVMSGLSTYMHVNGGKAVSNAQITTCGLVDRPNLEWVIQPVPEHPGYYYLCSALNPDCVLHQNGATQKNGDACTLYPQKTKHQNTWVTFEPASGDNWWYIKFAHSKKGTRVDHGHSGPGVPIVQWDVCEQPDLTWRFHPSEASFTTAFYEQRLTRPAQAREQKAADVAAQQQQQRDKEIGLGLVTLGVAALAIGAKAAIDSDKAKPQVEVHHIHHHHNHRTHHHHHHRHGGH